MHPNEEDLEKHYYKTIYDESPVSDKSDHYVAHATIHEVKNHPKKEQIVKVINEPINIVRDSPDHITYSSYGNREGDPVAHIVHSSFSGDEETNSDDEKAAEALASQIALQRRLQAAAAATALRSRIGPCAPVPQSRRRNPARELSGSLRGIGAPRRSTAGDGHRPDCRLRHAQRSHPPLRRNRR